MRRRWHVRVNALVLAWALGAALVAVAHRAVPQAPWLMVHLLLLGAVSTAILIWSAHFAEAVRRRPLRGGHRDQAVRLALHTAGALTVVGGLLGAAWPAVVVGALCICLVGLWHAAVLVEQGHRALGLRLAWTAWYFVVAGVALPVGAVLGVVLAHPGTVGVGHARAYVAHVSVMLLGWVGLTVVGTTVTLWPTMLRVQLADDAHLAARHGLAVLGAGLVLVLVGAGTGLLRLAGAGVGVYLLGLLRVSWPLVAEARRRGPDTFGSRSVALAWVWFFLAVGLWTSALLTADGWAAAHARFEPLLGLLAVGFAAQVVAGALSHLGPVVTGGGPAAVRATRAVVERAGTARLVLVNGGLALYLLPVPSLVRVGTSILVLGALVATPVLLVMAAVASARRQPAVGPVLPTPVQLLVPARRPMGAGLVAVAALALVVAGAVAADPAAVGLGRPTAAGAEATGRVVEVAVEAGEMRFSPATVQVEVGDELVLVVTNVDDVVHDLVLDSGVASGRLAPGATARVEVGVVGRDVGGWCSVAGHRQMGMTFDVEVVGGPSTGPSTGSDMAEAADEDVDEGHHAGTAGVMDLMAAPADGFVAHDAALGAAPAGTVHRMTLEVQEVEREVAPGVTGTVWTFGGSAPGPVLHGRVGDTFEITLVNDGSIGHSIDFHAGALSPAEPMRTIEPGESLLYRFTATRSGIWMYHCSTMPMSLHIANGMFGAVVIDPPGLPDVDREYVLVQSELYLGQEGGVADSEAIAAERPDAVMFNGYPGQYDDAPLEARTGERVRVWVLDAGPNRASSFHVVGGQFDTVFQEGAYLLGGPDADPSDTGGAQVLGLLPSQGGFVELVLPQAGRYPFVSHLMVDAERGAHGYLSVTD